MVNAGVSQRNVTSICNLNYAMLNEKVDCLLLGAPWLPKSSTVPRHRAPEDYQFGFHQVTTWQ